MLRALLFVPVRSLGNYVAFNRVEAELEKGRGKRRWILAGWLTGRWTDERTNETESGFASSSALSPPPVNHCRVAAADGSWKEGRKEGGELAGRSPVEKEKTDSDMCAVGMEGKVRAHLPWSDWMFATKRSKRKLCRRASRRDGRE